MRPPAAWAAWSEILIARSVEDAGYFSTVKPKLYKFFLDAGVLLRPLGNVLYVLPPYAITADQLHFVHDRIQESLELFK